MCRPPRYGDIAVEFDHAVTLLAFTAQDRSRRNPPGPSHHSRGTPSLASRRAPSFRLTRRGSSSQGREDSLQFHAIMAAARRRSFAGAAVASRHDTQPEGSQRPADTAPSRTGRRSSPGRSERHSQHLRRAYRRPGIVDHHLCAGDGSAETGSGGNPGTLYLDIPRRFGLARPESGRSCRRFASHTHGRQRRRSATVHP